MNCCIEKTAYEDSAYDRKAQMGEQHRIFFGMEMKCHVQDRFITEEKK
jgi:hypothetical protein